MNTYTYDVITNFKIHKLIIQIHIQMSVLVVYR